MSLVTETSAKLAARNSRIETFTVIQHRTDNCSFSPYTVGVCLSWNLHELYDDQTRPGEATGFEETGMKRLVTSFFFSRDEFYIFSCSIFSSWNIDVYLLFVLYILFLQFSFFSSRFLDIRYWWRFWKVYFRKKFWEEKIFKNEQTKKEIFHDSSFRCWSKYLIFHIFFLQIFDEGKGISFTIFLLIDN